MRSELYPEKWKMKITDYSPKTMVPDTSEGVSQVFFGSMGRENLPVFFFKIFGKNREKCESHRWKFSEFSYLKQSASFRHKQINNKS